MGGGNSATNNGQQTLVEHWNGAVWSVVPSPNAGLDDFLDGVAVVASNDIWAAGRTHVGGADQTLIEHWNGTAWSLVPSPNPSAPSAQLLDIMVSAPGDIWAVGNYTNNTPALQTLVEHWNGTTWTIVNSPNPGVGANFTSVAGDAADNVWAVGYYFDANQSNTLVEHWDGTTSMIANSPDAGPYPSNLSGVAVVAPDDVWAVGYSYDNVAYQVLTVRYNPCPTSCAITFDDVPAGSTFYPYVRCLACQSIISGYQCGGQGEPCPGAYFRPGNPVTRGQVSKFVVNAAGFQNPVPSTRQTFQDVPHANAFWLYVERLSAQGYISGYPCGQAPAGPCVPPGNRPYFLPGSNVTRGQLAKIDANAVGFNDPPSTQTFQDVPPASPFYQYTERVALHQVISGYPCGHTPAGPCVPPGDHPYYLPGNNVTRGQTSKIVSNTFFPGCQY